MDELVTVGSFDNVNDAHLAKLRLDAAGIDAVIIDAETVTMNWFWGRALGMIKVQVREPDAACAIEVLAGGGEPASEEGEESE